jgi:hypothetical protein
LVDIEYQADQVEVLVEEWFLEGLNISHKGGIRRESDKNLKIQEVIFTHFGCTSTMRGRENFRGYISPMG